MDIELLAKQMRERAIIVGVEESADIAQRKSRQLPKPKYKSVDDRIEELKRLYFNAGRWSGGSRDHKARMAFEQIEKMDSK